MTKYDRFIYAIGSFLLTLSLSGCGNEDNEYDRSAFYEGGDTVIIEDETVPLSDEMAIKIDRTLYLLKDNNISSVHDLTIQDNVRKRFARQQVVNVGDNIAFHNGDCMMIDVNDIKALQSNQDIAPVFKKFYDGGGALLFVQPTKSNIENFFCAIGDTVLTTQEDNKINEVVIYKNDMNDGHVNVSVFDDLCNTDDGVYKVEDDVPESAEPEEEANDESNITEYTQGLYADQVVSDVNAFIGTHVNPSKSVQTRSSASRAVHDISAAYQFRFHNSYTLCSNNYYDSSISGGTDYFFYEVDVWPFKKLETGDVYIYMEYIFSLNFSAGYRSVYRHHTKGRQYKVMEWAGNKVEWSCHTPIKNDVKEDPCYYDATTSDYVYEHTHAPTTSESSKQYTSSMSVNVGGSLTGGFQGTDPTGSAGVSGGVTFGNTITETFPDVSYTDHSKNNGNTSYVGGQWELADAISKYATLNYGLVRVYEPAKVGRSTFCPHAACLFVVSPQGKNPKGGVGKNIYIFDTKITLSSYGAFSNASSGKMRKCSYTTDFSGVVDLSKLRFYDSDALHNAKKD